MEVRQTIAEGGRQAEHQVSTLSSSSVLTHFDTPDDMVPTRYMRVNPPVHYTLKIGSFSLLSSIVGKFRSGKFEVGGHNWILSLYPHGDSARDGGDHISLYLSYAEKNKLALGLEINVIFKFFLYNQILDKYLTIQDSEGRVRRFHKTMTEHGFSQLIPLATFNNASNGYLVDDSCEFGVEVFVLENRTKGEHLTLLKKSDDDWHFTWTISNFSTLEKTHYISEEFQGGNRKWRLEIHPRGYLTQMENYLSILVGLADYVSDERTNSDSNYSKFMHQVGIFKRYITRTLTRKNENRCKMYVETKFRVVDQLHNKHVDKTDRQWFTPNAYEWGFFEYVRLSDLHDPSKGLLVDDTLIVQVKFNVIYAVKQFS